MCCFNWNKNKLFEKTTFCLVRLQNYNYVKNIIFKITEMDVKIMKFWYLVFSVTPKHDFDVLMCFKSVTWRRIKWATFSNISLISQISSLETLFSTLLSWAYILHGHKWYCNILGIIEDTWLHPVNSGTNSKLLWSIYMQEITII